MQTVTKEKLIENCELIPELVKEKISEPNKTALLEFFDGDLGELFFTAPASGKTKYHLACPGGLAQHCLNVFSTFKKLNKEFNLNFSEEDMLLCSLLHDLGKTCCPSLKNAHYVEQTNEWRKKNGEPYQANYDGGYFTNRDRTTYLIQACGFKLTPGQYQAILLADGWFSPQSQPYNDDIEPLSYFTHFADFIATRIENMGL